MEIRRATLSDMDGMKKLLYQVAHVHHLGRPDLFKPTSKKYTDEEMEELIGDDSHPIFVAIDGDEVVAHLYAVLHEVHNSGCLCDIKTMYIDDLCVEESRRGRHIGRKMYDFIKQYAKTQGCYNITLNVWCCNSDAIKFYEKLGLLPQKIGMEEIL